MAKELPVLSIILSVVWGWCSEILPVLVYFRHESLYSVYAQHGAFDQAYINDTEVSPVKITLFFDKNYNLKKLNSKELLLNGQE